ncbi:MAG: ChaN family lipoprotein [Thioalkalivibrio sp.]
MPFPVQRIPSATPILALMFLLFLGPIPSLADQAPRHGDHPLVGHLWWTGESDGPHAEIQSSEAMGRLAQADVVLLGEVHGNPDHHRGQLEVVRALVSQGVRPALAFEIFDLGDQDRIDTLRRDGDPDADALAAGVKMESRGWDWSGYRPLVQFALDEGLVIIAANLSRSRAMDVARGGLAVLPQQERQRLGLDQALKEGLRERLEQRIVDAHCGHLPRERAGGMIDAQRARDAYMADRLARVEGPVVLITGAVHGHRDYGVPAYLARLAPERRLASVAFVEVDPARPVASDYANSAGSPYDLLWFTRRSSPDDACEAFRKQLEGMSQG